MSQDLEIIDVHAHFVPPSLIEYARTGEGPDAMRIERRDDTEMVFHKDLTYELPARLYDTTEKLAAMDRDGIDVSVLALASNFFAYVLDHEDTAELCRLANDDVAAMVAEAPPGRLFGMATLPLNDPEAAAKELVRAREELGLVGICSSTSVGDTPLDDPSLDRVLTLAEEYQMPLMLHPYIYMMVDPPRGVSGFHLENVIGNPLETVVAGMRMIAAGALDRHPALEVQLSHGGGYFPYQIGRLQHAYESVPAASSVARKPPIEYLNQFLIDTIIYDEVALEFLIESIGVERVVYGTDLPFDMSDVLAQELATNTSPPWADAVMNGNARRSYGLGDRPAW
jgi:aminocarboxymuconate-semialdehyde decarboxylase